MGIDAQERAALSRAIRDAASGGPRAFLDEEGAPRRDGRLWTLLVDQMGLAAMLLPEENGGAGAGVTEVAVVLEQLAGALAVVPALSSLGAATALLRVTGTAAASSLLQEMASGGVTATVAWPDPQSVNATPVLSAAGSAEAGAPVAVNGHADFVLDGLDADVILAPAECDGRTVVVAIDATDHWVRRRPMKTLDLSRGFADLEFSEAPATILGTGEDLQCALDLMLVLIAAEQIGIAQRCHESAVEWAKERIQFDRPIGQFQAIKHKLVDLLMALELARSSLDIAVAAADAYLATPGPATARPLSIAASTAKARCGEAATLITDEALHIFGGIGFTWEHDSHLYFRRAKTLEVFLGTPAVHRRRSATMLLEVADIA